MAKSDQKMLNVNMSYKKSPPIIRRGTHFQGFCTEFILFTQIQVFKLIRFLKVFVIEVFHEVDALAG